MRISALKRWHWLVVAVIVGWTGGRLWQSARDFEDELDGYVKVMTDQRAFENALVRVIDGQRQFRDLIVYPYQVNDTRGGRRLVHIVSGWYWDGHPQVRDGQPSALYVRACYLASVPYVPRGVDASPATGTPPAPLASSTTVVDFLKTLEGKNGLQYRYAWWWWFRTPMFGWMAFSLTFIGGVLPTVVNLVAFGSLRRPKDAEGFSFWDLRTVRKPQRRKSSQDRLTAIPLPQGIKAEADEPAAAEPLPAEEPAIRRLVATPLEPAALTAEERKKAFGAGAGDYYPTELKHPPVSNEPAK